MVRDEIVRRYPQSERRATSPHPGSAFADSPQKQIDRELQTYEGHCATLKGRTVEILQFWQSKSQVVRLK